MSMLESSGEILENIMKKEEKNRNLSHDILGNI